MLGLVIQLVLDLPVRHFIHQVGDEVVVVLVE